MQKKALQMAGQVVCMLLAEIQPPSLRQQSTETTVHAHRCSSQIAVRQPDMLELYMLHQQSQALAVEHRLLHAPEPVQRGAHNLCDTSMQLPAGLLQPAMMHAGWPGTTQAAAMLGL